MGFLDRFRGKAEKVVEDHGDQIKSGVDKAGDFVDDKTGGKYTDKIQTAEDKMSDAVDKMDDDGPAPATQAKP